MISKTRNVIISLAIIQSNGSEIDVSDSLLDATIECGSLSTAGDTGVDGIARTMTFALKNDISNNFSPLSKYGVVKYATQVINGNGGKTYTLANENAIENSIRLREGAGYTSFDTTFSVSGTTLTSSAIIPNGTTIRIGYSYIDKTAVNLKNWIVGSRVEYSPLIFENRFVRMRELTDEPIYYTMRIYGTGDTTYSVPHANIIRDTVRIKNVVGISESWNDKGTWENAGTWDTIKTTSDYWTNCISIDYNSQSIIFDPPLPNGAIIEIMYSYVDGAAKTIFEGYITEYTSKNTEISVTAKDLAKLLQDRFILSGEIRAYTTAYTEGVYYVTDPVTSTVYTNGIPVETMIQNCLNDLDLSYIGLYCPVSPLYTILPKTEQWEYKTAWDLIQQYTNNIGWTTTAKYNSSTDSFRLTLLNVPRTKVTVDYALTGSDDIYVEELTVSGNSIRNSIVVGFNDAENNNEKTYCPAVEDTTSISVYGKRPVIIEEENSQGIDTMDEATAMATAILADCKDLQGSVRVEMPLFTNIDLFSTVSIDNYRLSSSIDLIGVQSVQHRISPRDKQFRTSFMGCQKVIGGRTKWRDMQTRKGKFRQVTTKVADSIFAQIRDNTLHIKNQLQFDFWIQSLPSSSPSVNLTTAYTKVFIYDGSYNLNIFGKFIQMKKFEMKGVGNVKINCSGSDVTSQTIFTLISDNFTYDNIDINVGSYNKQPFLLKPYPESTAFTILSIYNSDFYSANIINFVEYIGTKADVRITIQSNSFENFIVFTNDTYTDFGTLTISDNSIINGKVLLAQERIANINILNNTIVDAYILFYLEYGGGTQTFKNIDIRSNKIYLKTDPGIDKSFIAIYMTYTMEITLIANMVIFANQMISELAVAPYHYNFLKFTSVSANYIGVKCITMFGNVAYSSYGAFMMNWLCNDGSYVITQQRPAILSDYNSKE